MNAIEIRDLLAFERAYPTPGGGKDTAIRAAFGVRPVRYYQMLHDAVATREALELDAITTNRVRAAMQRRAHARTRGGLTA